MTLCRRAICPVHPRACGERPATAKASGIATGSSPRLRGTHLESVLVGLAGRFIPAPAGNAPVKPGPWKWQTVHPRACGERRLPSRCSGRSAGSSPRLRGTRQRPVQGIGRQRFIPAPAGNALSIPCTRTVTRGSSPRLRGTLAVGAAHCALARFIPAPAGNAPTAAGSTPTKPVHPAPAGNAAAA